MSRAPNGPWPENTDEAQALVDAIADDATEPPPGARARVWSAIEARRRGRGRLLLRIGLVATAALALAIGLSLRRSSTATARRWLGPAAQVVDLHGAARLVIAGGSDVALVEDDARGIVLSVATGSVLLQVNHRPDGAPLSVRAPRAIVKVVGTTLWVDVARGDTTVEVARGVVEVTPAGQAPISLAAGQRWPAEAERAPAADEIALLGPVALDGAAFTATARRAPPTVATVARATAPRPMVIASRAPTASPICLGLDRAKEASCLAALADGSDPLKAELARYEIGWRALRERGDARAALAAWERQRKRFPDGVLRAEADASIIEALVRLGEDARARREIDAWLVEHPDGILTSEVLFLRGSLDRAAGDCARAVADFDAALRAPAEPWATEARAERAACLATRGR